MFIFMSIEEFGFLRKKSMSYVQVFSWRRRDSQLNTFLVVPVFEVYSDKRQGRVQKKRVEPQRLFVRSFCLLNDGSTRQQEQKEKWASRKIRLMTRPTHTESLAK